MVDIDPQGNATMGCGINKHDLKKLRRAEGGAKIFGVFRVKNHDFTPKNHIFYKIISLKKH
jgi:cellulose biosynthesis protein BcsQ